MEDVRRAIRGQVQALVGNAGGERVALDTASSGLFPPDAACRTVHGDFTAMMIGGVAALLLQMLHPAALAGVWDHSNFRADPRGRLRRTAQFIAVTTYGSAAQAEAAIGRVRRIHEKVEGRLPDGTAYRASDPALLEWVHVAEAWCFLAGHLRYRDPAFPRHRQDRYFAEMAEIAQALGAGAVPATRGAAEAYLRAMRPRLRVDARTREIADALLSGQPPSLAAAPAQAVMLGAGLDLLPGWARAMHGRSVPMVGRPMVRAGAQGLGLVLRWALRS